MTIVEENPVLVEEDNEVVLILMKVLEDLDGGKNWVQYRKDSESLLYTVRFPNHHCLLGAMMTHTTTLASFQSVVAAFKQATSINGVPEWNDSPSRKWNDVEEAILKTIAYLEEER